MKDFNQYNQYNNYELYLDLNKLFIKLELSKILISQTFYVRR